MTVSIWRVLLPVLLFASLASCTWAMRKFFVRPKRLSAGLAFTLVAWPAFACLHFFFLFTTHRFEIWAASVALVCYLGALGIFWWAIAVNRHQPLAACFSKGEQLHVTQAGPYRFIRHPFYCSYLLTWFAGAIATLSVTLGFTFAAMLALYFVAAREEEAKFRASSLAGTYEDYRRRTGQFFPAPWKLRVGRRPS